MLGREHGALALIGHVDRAWSYSFSWPGAGAQTEVFRSLLARIGAGDPLGAAMGYMTDRYAELATELALAIEQVRLGRRPQEEQIAGMWTAYADARDFVVIGDPAVSLARLRRDPAVSSNGARRLTIDLNRPAQAVAPTGEEPAMPVPSPAGPEPERATTADRGGAIEVATYVATDMDRVAVDPTTGRITGADLVLLSYVDLDGTANHVVADAWAADRVDVAAREAAAQIHARLLEVSLAARRVPVAQDDRGGAA
jgi:hypothetical protein